MSIQKHLTPECGILVTIDFLVQILIMSLLSLTMLDSIPKMNRMETNDVKPNVVKAVMSFIYELECDQYG
ncbi:hypothetical protein STEG23_010315 [Scotinomys teguina]